MTAFAIGLLGFTLLASPLEAGTLKTMNQNGTNLVPLRVISEELGANVDYNGASKKITVAYNESVIVTTIGKKSALVNGKQQELQVAPQLINGATYVPIRFIGEALGGLVDYQTGALKITIADQVKEWKLKTTVHDPKAEALNKKSYYQKKIAHTKIKEIERYNDPDIPGSDIYDVVWFLWYELSEEIENVLKANLSSDEMKQYNKEEEKYNQKREKVLIAAELEFKSIYGSDAVQINPHHDHYIMMEMMMERCEYLVEKFMK